MIENWVVCDSWGVEEELEDLIYLPFGSFSDHQWKIYATVRDSIAAIVVPVKIHLRVEGFIQQPY